MGEAAIGRRHRKAHLGGVIGLPISPPEFLAFVVLGAVCGFVGGLFGVGGAVVAIPVLGIAFGKTEQVAQGTAFVMVVPTLIVGLWRYFHVGKVDARMALAMAAGSLPTTILAALLATSVSNKHLRIAYACFLIAMMIEYARRSLLMKAGDARARLPWPYIACVGMVAGALYGLFTVGGTLFSISVNTWLFGISQLTAQGLALVSSVPATIISTYIYARAGQVDWALAIPLAIGGVTTVVRGVDLAHRLPERALRMLYVAFIFVSSLSLLIKALVAER
jgi:uncharacterized membrane protein YfcA